MTWTDNKTLLEYSEYTPCQDIFQAVCDELGKLYEKRGFKYSRSKPKLTIDDEKIKLEIAFWSSRINVSGELVKFEIVPNFYSKQLAKTSKIKGFLFGHTALFYHKYTENRQQIRVEEIFGDVTERVDKSSKESKLIENNICNIYGIDKEKFHAIVQFIDDKILPWASKLNTDEGIKELITNASSTRIASLQGKNVNSDFINYVRLNFPDSGLLNELVKKVV